MEAVAAPDVREGGEAPRPDARPAVSLAATSLFAAVLGLTFLVPMSSIATSALDPSWTATQGLAWLRGLRAGVDFVGPFGPLGGLYHPPYLPGLFWTKWWWELVSKALGAGFIAAAAGRGTTRRDLLWAAALAALLGGDEPAGGGADAFALATVAAVAVLFAEETAHRIWIAGLGFPLLAAQGLVKSTWLAAAAAAFGTWLLVPVSGTPLPRRLPWLGAALAVFGAIWVACGQRGSDLGAFLRGTAEYAAGYGPAMAIEPPRLVQALAVSSALALLLGLALRARGAARGSGPWVTGWMLAPVVLIGFKAGLVRGDHEHVYYIAVRLLVLTPLLVLGSSPAPARRWLRCGIALAVAAEALSLSALSRPLSTRFLEVGQHAEQALDWVLSPGTRQAEFRAAWEAHPARASWPEVRKWVGGRPLDLFGVEQGRAVLLGLDLRPRPVFQSYAALTPYLLAANSAYFAGPTAPDFVLLEPWGLDDRPLLWEDAPALREVFRRYRVVAAPAQEPVVLERLPGEAPPRPLAVLAEGSGRLGDWIELPAAPLQLGLSLEVEPSWRGALRSLLLRPARLAIELGFAGVGVHRALPIPAAAREPILVAPLLRNRGGSQDWLHGRLDLRPTRVRITSPEPGPWWGAHFSYRLWEGAGLAPPALAPAVLPPSPRGALCAPIRAAALAFEPLELEGHQGWLLHARGEMAFVAPAGTQRLQAKFALRPGAYLEGHTDGVQFRVLRNEGGRTTVLFDRTLDPVHRGEDRGLQSVSVTTRASDPGEVVFETLPGAASNSDWDWSWWGEIRLEPETESG